MKNILFADDFNFREKNFPNLEAYLKKFDVRLIYDKKFNEVKKESGTLNTSLLNDININYQLTDFEIESLIKDEVAYMIASDDAFLEEDIDVKLDLNSFLYSNVVDIAKNRASFWYSYWSQNLQVDISIVFGGNTIYSKALMMVCKKRNIPCYVVEHAFTGNDYYFSMQYDALPNNIYVDNSKKNIHSNWVSRYKLKNNKNVKSETLRDKIEFKDYILILCQVRNDYSIVSGKNRYTNTPKFYQKLIEKLLKITDDNIVVKCHPYEDKKINGLLTYDYLENFISTLSLDDQKRIRLLKEFELETLIFDSKFAITLTSQSGLEVLASNKPLITFNDAFYSRKGFTYDLNTIDDLNEKLLKNIPLFLEIEKYNLFYNFMSNYFDLLYSSENLNKIAEELNLNKKEFENQNVVKKNVNNTNPIQVAKPIHKEKNEILSHLYSEKALSKKNNFSKDKMLRLSKKFIRDPKIFLEDSKSPLLKKISNLFN